MQTLTNTKHFNFPCIAWDTANLTVSLVEDYSDVVQVCTEAGNFDNVLIAPYFASGYHCFFYNGECLEFDSGFPINY